MSLELPEAYILAGQMQKELVGKQVVSWQLQEHEKFQKLGFISKDSAVFNQLVSAVVEKVVSRGNVIRVKLGNGVNLLLAPEYGGKITFHTKEVTVPAKFHLKLCFSDGTLLTVTLTGMGIIQTLKDNELMSSYVYRRDYSQTLSPVDDKEFRLAKFSAELADRNVNIKQTLVGKDAVIVGLGNSMFQDLIYRAKIHPKRKASELSDAEKKALFDFIKLVIRERIRLSGKTQFQDLYGKQGNYTAAMGPNMKDQTCPTCGAKTEKLNLGGGQVYLCPKCQT